LAETGEIGEGPVEALELVVDEPLGEASGFTGFLFGPRRRAVIAPARKSSANNGQAGPNQREVEG
jgi:hypothetical protein